MNRVRLAITIHVPPALRELASQLVPPAPFQPQADGTSRDASPIELNQKLIAGRDVIRGWRASSVRSIAIQMMNWRIIMGGRSGLCGPGTKKIINHKGTKTPSRKEGPWILSLGVLVPLW